MRVKVNGEERELNDGATVLDLLGVMGIEMTSKGVAVAINSEIAPRDGWELRHLTDGDAVEVLRPMQGG